MSPLSDDDMADPDPDTDEASSSSPRTYSPELIRDMEILKEKHLVTTDGTKTIAAIAAAGLTATAASATGIYMQVKSAAGISSLNNINNARVHRPRLLQVLV